VKAWLLSMLVLPVALGGQLVLKVQVSGRITAVPLERYVAGVVGAESGVFRSGEALKAMAVAARTYGVRMRGRHGAEGFDVCDTTHCQRMDLSSITPRFGAAAAATEGELLWFHGKPAFTPYSRDCGGKTEDAGAVWPELAAPYLKSHADAWSADEPRWRWRGSAEQILQALRQAGLQTPARIEGISILSSTPSGRAATLVLTGRGGASRVSASAFRFAMGRELGWNTIRSDAYAVRPDKGGFAFDGAGSGHGVGLCQLGTERMGVAGKSYREILEFYYPGTTLAQSGEGIPWQRLRGRGITFLTVNHGNDRVAMEAAERLSRALLTRTGWPLPEGLELRIYPDLDAFRNATGEPGWVAARTDGRRIHLSPVEGLRKRGVLESTIAHELLHALMDGQAAPGLPVWFREGLSDVLDKQPVTGVARIPLEADLRQRTDPARARRAYADAAAMVASLVRRYGETAVVGWVRRGVPAEVTYASASQPKPNSK
jgi:stage II sporulation protein D